MPIWLFDVNEEMDEVRGALKLTPEEAAVLGIGQAARAGIR